MVSAAAAARATRRAVVTLRLELQVAQAAHASSNCSAASRSASEAACRRCCVAAVTNALLAGAISVSGMPKSSAPPSTSRASDCIAATRMEKSGSRISCKSALILRACASLSPAGAAAAASKTLAAADSRCTDEKRCTSRERSADGRRCSAADAAHRSSETLMIASGVSFIMPKAESTRRGTLHESTRAVTVYFSRKCIAALRGSSPLLRGGPRRD